MLIKSMRHSVSMLYVKENQSASIFTMLLIYYLQLINYLQIYQYARINHSS